MCAALARPPSWRGVWRFGVWRLACDMSGRGFLIHFTHVAIRLAQNLRVYESVAEEDLQVVQPLTHRQNPGGHFFSFLFTRLREDGEEKGRGSG